jgi:hypothetical protein
LRTVSNIGSDRVLDAIRASSHEADSLDVATERLSLFAFEELRADLGMLSLARLMMPSRIKADELLGGAPDRTARNRLTSRSLALKLAQWVATKAEIRQAPDGIPQGIVVVKNGSGSALSAIAGSFALDTPGIGMAPGNPLSMVQAAEGPDESERFAVWFEETWAKLESDGSAERQLVEQLRRISSLKAPREIYAHMLNCLLSEADGALDEEEVVRSATGIRDSVVWKKLYKFQRDGVVGAIDKLNRFGGCIIADSVGLGKTFEALAVIKYHELRNDRVLVLCPKRLRENWTVYRTNDRRNVLVDDRLNYDVLNHTDLSRDGGMSGDIDLANLNWGNYDLVVIDESHNFRNKNTPKQGGETRYDKLMRQIVKEGVKTRVLMLSATPVNNRLADLRNQIAFATEGRDNALADQGIASIEATTRRAQQQFNSWQKLDEEQRRPERLIADLDFDYFTLLDRLTIARSRKHVEKYYGTSETGRFPERRKPINIKADIDTAGEFPAIDQINKEIRRLSLAAYSPLKYVLPHKQADYDARYSTRVSGGKGSFRQVDREQSLVHLMRVNLLKRLESAISSFALSLERQLAGVNRLLDRIDSHETEVGEPDIADVDLDDPEIEPLLVGNRVKVLLSDVDLIRWRNDLVEDRERLSELLAEATEVDPSRDAKLMELKEMIRSKCQEPINEGNRKVIVFTAYSDTAEYLFGQISGWAEQEFGLQSALVTGGRQNVTTIPGLRRDLSSVLAAFSPRAKERPEEFAEEGDLDLLIATDCVSEGQNLQDCDWVINYDIHWNPVRIVQRFGRIDRIGSSNQEIQLANFWPNMELDEYINLENRVSGRMVLLDVSATGEENLIERESGDPMNDLEYRRKQLVKLQDSVIDMEDLSAGVSITDLTLSEFRIDLAQYRQQDSPIDLDLPLGTAGAVMRNGESEAVGMVFCLRGVTDSAANEIDPAYPLSPHYLVWVDREGRVMRDMAQVQKSLNDLKSLCSDSPEIDEAATRSFDSRTSGGRDMSEPRKLLAAAFASIVGRGEERSAASLFAPGGTRALPGEMVGEEDFEVVAYLSIEDNSDA